MKYGLTNKVFYKAIRAAARAAEQWDMRYSCVSCFYCTAPNQYCSYVDRSILDYG